VICVLRFNDASLATCYVNTVFGVRFLSDLCVTFIRQLGCLNVQWRIV
jgi:hypothetical protein